jgi:hypothetical protein
MASTSSTTENTTEEWKLSEYPYQTDYNDHFETPIKAYEDVAPILGWLASGQNGSSSNREDTDTAPTLYDPYFCNGRTKVLLQKLGFANVIHEKRDFYADIKNAEIPDNYDVFISNPPYSDTHKERCLEFCFKQLRQGTPRKRPFLLLMPNYTASKQYFRNLLSAKGGDGRQEDVVYLVPAMQESYHYEHPEKTGKNESPFESLWFCGVGSDRVDDFKKLWDSLNISSKPVLATSLAELESMNVITLKNRPNPRQRRKKRKNLYEDDANACTDVAKPRNSKEAELLSTQANALKAAATKGNNKSKYRDKSGERNRKRF